MINIIYRTTVELVLVHLMLVGAAQPECPIQCNCVPNGMSCELPGLNRIPLPYSTLLEYLLVENQTFSNTHLGPAELNRYKSPEFGGQLRLKRLYIRWCNIETVGRNAFESLGSHLEMIDLTGNPLKHIGGYAFAGLGQLTLILDKIKPPKFDPHVFSGLRKMKSLFLRDSNLSTLPFEPLLRLTLDGKLDQLLLKGNKLHTLTEKYDKIFGRLQEFEIHGNPWHCDCHLTWLIRRYQAISTRRLPEYKNHERKWANNPTWDNWSQEDKQPKCASPSNINGRNFSDLITDVDGMYDRYSDKSHSVPSILYCPPPTLERLDIDLKKYLQYMDQNSNPSAQVSCVMRGSEKLKVSWKNHVPGLDALTVPDLNTTSRKTGLFTAELVPWSMRNNDIFRTESILKIERQGDIDSYSCVGGDVMGNVSANLRIHWPLRAIETISSTTAGPKIVKTNQTLIDPPSRSEDDVSAESISILHTPQFTLGQLLAAIIGTFVTTVLLFCIIHYALHYPWGKCPNDSHSDMEKIQNGSVGLSPGGTSSSNISSNNTNMFSNQKVHDAYPPANAPNVLNPDLLSLQAMNLLNAHTYQQFLNGVIGNQPINFAHGPVVSMSNPTFLPNEMSGQNQFLRGHPEQPFQSLSVTYEPVSYTEASTHLTYDVPCSTNANFLLGQPMDQHVPLLFSNRLEDATLNFRHSNAPMLHSGLSIPPPPSIPQPSLPPTPTSSVGDQLTTSSRTSSTLTPNLLVLQSTAYNPQPPQSIESISASHSSPIIPISSTPHLNQT